MWHLAILVLWVGLFTSLLTANKPNFDKRPNIIIVMADDLGFADLGCYGSEVQTPTIDGLAREGLRFANFYNFASCGPSRASLMTGLYPWQVGQRKGRSIFENLTGNRVTLLQLMKEGGYFTGAVGRLDMVTAEDWHKPKDISEAVDRYLGSISGVPGNYFKEVPQHTHLNIFRQRFKSPDGLR